jgi:autotransporter-associated beta strand protein
MTINGNISMGRGVVGAIANATLNMNSGNLTAGTINIGVGSYSNSTVNLNGGTLSINNTASPGSVSKTSTLRFNGGTLRSRSDNGSFVAGLSNAFVDSGGAFIDIDGRTSTISQVLQQGTGSGGLTLLSTNGGGTLTLSGNNAYTGATTLNAGTLQIGHANALGTSGNITFGGGTLQYGSGITTDLSSRLKNSASAIIVDTNAHNVTFASAIDSTNSNGLTKIGTGNLTLNAANTFNGATSVNNGILVLGNALALQNSALDTTASVAGNSTVGLRAPTTTLTLGGLTGSKDLASLFTTTSGNYSSVTSLTLNPGIGVTNSYSGNIANGAAGMTLIKTGAGTQILSGNNSYTGVTTFNAGTLQIGHANALGTSGNITFGGGTLQYGSGITTDLSSRLKNSASAIIVDTNANNVTFASAIDSSNSGGLTKTGSGTLTLSATNTYTGSTTISAGNLTLLGGNALSNTESVILAIAAGVGLNIDASEQIGGLQGGGATGGIVTIAANQTLTVNQQSDQTFAGVIAGSGALTKSGTGALILSGNNTYSGSTIVTAGTLQTSGATGLGASVNFNTSSTSSLVINGATSTTNFNISNIPPNGTSATVNLSGSDTLTVSTNFIVGAGTNANAATATGILNQSSGTVAGNTLIVGRNGANGTWNLSGGSATGTSLQIGSNVFGGANGTGTVAPTGTVNISGGSINTTTSVLVGVGGAPGYIANGTLNINSGSLTTTTVNVGFGNQTTGTVNLNGGVLTTTNTRMSGTVNATSTFRFNGGTLRSGGDSALFITGLTNAFVDSGGALIDINGRTSTIAQALLQGTGAGSLTLSSTAGGGTLTISGVNTFTGATTINGGNLTILGGSSLSDTAEVILANSAGAGLNVNASETIGGLQGGGASGGTVTIDASQTLTVNQSTTQAFAGVVAGTGSLTKGGSGTLTLSGSNTNNGTKSINAGTLQIGHANALGTSGNITFGGGTLQYGSGITTDLSSRLKNSASAIIVDTNANNVTFASAIDSANSGGLTKTGSGTLTLNATNTYTGSTTINAGNLTLLGGNALSNTESVILANAAGVGLNVNASETIGTLQGGGASGGIVTIAANQTLTVNQQSDQTFAGVITGSGTLTKSGTGALILSGNNTYSGSTNVDGGTLQIAGTTGLGSSLTFNGNSTSALVINGAANTTNVYLGNSPTNGFTTTVNLSGNNALATTDFSVGQLTSSNPATATAILNQSSGTINAAGTLGVGRNGSNGTWTLSGGAVSGNALWVGLDVRGGTGGSGSVAPVGTMTVAGGNMTIAGSILLGRSNNASYTASATLNVNSGSASATTVSVGFGNNSTGIVNLNGGTLTATNVNMPGTTGATGTFRFNGGTLRSGGDSTTFMTGLTNAFVDSGGAFIDINGRTSTIAQALLQGTGAGGLTLSSTAGGGTLTLSGSNTYTGATTISSGNLSVTTTSAIGSTSGVNLANATALLYTGNAATLDRNITVTSGTGTIRNNGTGLLSLSGSLAKNGTTLRLQGGSNGITVSGAISGSSNDSDLIIDGGSVTLASANSYNGPTSIINGATLNANTLNALPTANGRTALVMDATGIGNSTLALGVSQAIASFAGNTTSTVTLGSNTLTIGTTSGNTTYAGRITGSSSSALVKDGASTQVLSGNNSAFTGTTTINSGTLQAASANALGSTTAIDVNGGSFLVTAANAVNDDAAINLRGGTLAVNGTFDETVGLLTLSANSVIDLNGFTGTLRFGGVGSWAASANLQIWNWNGINQYRTPVGDGLNNRHVVFTNNDGLSSYLDRISFYSGSGSGFAGTGFAEGFTGPGGGTEIIAVPEPETYIATIALLASLGIQYLRRRAKRKPLQGHRPA